MSGTGSNRESLIKQLRESISNNKKPINKLNINFSKIAKIVITHLKRVLRRKGFKIEQKEIKNVNQPIINIVPQNAKKELYKKHVEEQETLFIQFVNYFNSIICILRKYNLLGEINLKARIKSEKSALNNSSKSLDDIFGIEIITQNIGEAAFVSMLYNSMMFVTKENALNKENGYAAYHTSGFPNRNCNISDQISGILKKKYDVVDEFKDYIDRMPNTKKVYYIADKNFDETKRLVEFLVTFYYELNKYISSIQLTQKELEELQTALAQIQREYEEKIGNCIQPIMELQTKPQSTVTQEQASHEKYKGGDFREVEAAYKNGERIDPSCVPQMWVSDCSIDTEGKPRPPKKISNEEAFKMVYPGIIEGATK